MTEEERIARNLGDIADQLAGICDAVESLASLAKSLDLPRLIAQYGAEFEPLGGHSVKA